MYGAVLYKKQLALFTRYTSLKMFGGPYSILKRYNTGADPGWEGAYVQNFVTVYPNVIRCVEMSLFVRQNMY